MDALRVSVAWSEYAVPGTPLVADALSKHPSTTRGFLFDHYLSELRRTAPPPRTRAMRPLLHKVMGCGQPREAASKGAGMESGKP